MRVRSNEAARFDKVVVVAGHIDDSQTAQPCQPVISNSRPQVKVVALAGTRNNMGGHPHPSQCVGAYTSRQLAALLLVFVSHSCYVVSSHNMATSQCRRGSSRYCMLDAGGTKVGKASPLRFIIIFAAHIARNKTLDCVGE